MKKIDKIILHIPIIGLLYMMATIGGNKPVQDPIAEYKQLKWPLIIQIFSIVILAIVACTHI